MVYRYFESFRNVAPVLAVLVLAQVSQPQAQASIQTGDVAIIGLVSDRKNEWSWVPLVDLSAGEVIYFSDTSYSNRTGTLGPAESLVRYLTPAGGLAAGTVVTVEEVRPNNFSNPDHKTIRGRPWGTRRFDLARMGEPWLAFQTDDLSMGLSAPGFNPLFAVTSLTSDWDSYRGDPSKKMSNLYPGLTDGVDAVAAGRLRRPGAEWDNVRYVGPTVGTRAELLALIADNSLWEGTNRNPDFGYSSNGVSFFDVIPDAEPVHVMVNPEPTSLIVWSGIGLGVLVSQRRRRCRR